MWIFQIFLVFMLSIGTLNSKSIKHVKDEEREVDHLREFHHNDKDAAFDTIAKVNMAAMKDAEKEGKKRQLFESDIKIVDYPENVLDSSEALIGEPSSKRSLRRRQEFLWVDRIVPYEITEEVVYNERYVLQAMKNIEAISCIKFVPHTNEKNWIRFINDNGCFSNVGRNFWSSDSQEISLTRTCQERVGTIEHELLHTLGFWHEQSRPDRDAFIEIFWENIADGQEHNFDKYSREESDDFKSQYDPDSIMHYGKYAFSKNGKPTVLALGNLNKELGQRSGLSEEDKIQLNVLYKCQEVGEIYTSWTDWSPCRKSDCTKLRQRFCSHQNKQLCPDIDTRGVHNERVKCTDNECHAPENGHWGRWSSWGECSATCGEGVKSRTRKCNDPEPSDGGSACAGNAQSTDKCEIQPCGINPDDCFFDSQGMCFWKDISSSKNYIWSRHTGRTSTSSTGPDNDHTTANTDKTGHYVYAESSTPAQTGNKAKLLSKVFPAVDNRCITFFYSMYGFGMGALRLFQVNENGGETQLWEKVGEQEKGWLEAEVSFTASSDYKLRFEAERGANFKADIGLDDIHFRNTPCSVKGTAESKTGSSGSSSIPGHNVPHINIPGNMVPTCDGVKLAIQPLGCFADTKEHALSNLLDDHRTGHDGGNVINWQDYKGTLASLICHCVQRVKQAGYSHLSLQYYGLCYGGNAPDYGKYGPSTKCVNDKYQECSGVNTDSVCVGTEQTNYVYKIL